MPPKRNGQESIVLGGGCFWCTEAAFHLIPGVKSVIPGYAGGTVANPTYEAVSSENTGHAEVVKVDYDAKVASLDKILDVFFTSHDPTQVNRQGPDVGTQYRSIVLYTNKKQKNAAIKFIKKIQTNYDKAIVTEVKPLDKFYPAEDYHQRYYEKNPFLPYSLFVIKPKLDKVKKKFHLK